MGCNGPSGGAGWTELFFLDEVTALAAGHRPCFYCRRKAACAYRACIGADGNDAVTTAAHIDAILHRQRFAVTGQMSTLDADALAALPDAAMVVARDTVYALRGSTALPWSFSGYGKATPCSTLNEAFLLTPPLTVAALRGGYRPVWHPGRDES